MSTNCFGVDDMHRLYKTNSDISSPVAIYYYDIFGDTQICELNGILCQEEHVNAFPNNLRIKINPDDMLDGTYSCWLMSYAPWLLDLYKKYKFTHHPIQVDEFSNGVEFKFYIKNDMYSYLLDFEQMYERYDNDFIDIGYCTSKHYNDFIGVEIGIQYDFRDPINQRTVARVLDDIMDAIVKVAVVPVLSKMKTVAVCCHSCYSKLTEITFESSAEVYNITMYPSLRGQKCPECGADIFIDGSLISMDDMLHIIAERLHSEHITVSDVKSPSIQDPTYIGYITGCISNKNYNIFERIVNETVDDDKVELRYAAQDSICRALLPDNFILTFTLVIKSMPVSYGNYSEITDILFRIVDLTKEEITHNEK